MNTLEEAWLRNSELYRLFSCANRRSIEREQRHWPRRQCDVDATNRIHDRLLQIEQERLQLMAATSLFGDK